MPEPSNRYLHIEVDAEGEDLLFLLLGKLTHDLVLEGKRDQAGNIWKAVTEYGERN